MKFYQSIRFRVVAGILLFGALLLTLNSGITFFIMGSNMSKMVGNLLATEVDTFLYKYEKDKTTPLPHSKYMQVYTGIEKISEKFRGLVRDLPPGVHVVKGPGHPVHVGVIKLSDKAQRYYMFFRGREFFEENSSLHPRQILLLSLALLLIPAIVMVYFFSRAVFAPVSVLMKQVKALNPENIPSRFSKKHPKNEIGMLTETIEKAMNRINEFIRREKAFTRDASHELRTPLTIVKGAVEIMEQETEVEANPLLKRPLQRISRSVRDMENTIETFLWLAREESGEEEFCLVAPVAEKAINDNRYLLDKKNVEASLSVEQNKSVRVKEEVLYIAIANLVRNSFNFTSRGTVKVTVSENSLSVEDTGVGIAQDKIALVTRSHTKGEDSRGFGVGLNIVSRLCKRYGWRLDIKSDPEQSGTRVVIFWDAEKAR
ncbi:sensor histidine kinase [Dethiosulfatarculus sandiegensis]|uniref:histidine kinase n=1 Tax=Dethiosulfatarculus sandiegensis TaxID=1429043 RepID=A0A0D2JXL8_9BACT|nr:HAMP domain-containing sensor histidine kinase [Dethiosulfatarculus sandiegensis]KIX14330.1 hypothetical protein X474_08670 [Dethiosulfatarculus sandiegensis]